MFSDFRNSIVSWKVQGFRPLVLMVIEHLHGDDYGAFGGMKRGENRSIRRKTCCSASVPTKGLKWTDPRHSMANYVIKK